MIRFLVAIFLLIVCSNSSSIEKDFQSKKNGTLSFSRVDSYMFRRAYHGHDNLEGAALDIFMNRNPEPAEDFTFSEEHPMYNYLCDWGLFEDGDLNINDIDTLPDQFELKGPNKRIFNVETDYIEDLNEKSPFYELTFTENDSLVLKDTLWFEWPPDVVFLKKDIDNDGSEELLSIYRHYIINGDNFDVGIYSLKE